MPAVRVEVEKKYAADESFALPALAELVAGSAEGRGAAVDPGTPVTEGQAESQRLEATYFDTADLRLAAAGLTLARRTGGDGSGWHLRVPTGTGAGEEIRLPPGRLPPGRTPRAVPDRLQSMVWAQTHGRPLQPVARITTERTLRRLSDPTGQVLLEVADYSRPLVRVAWLDPSGRAPPPRLRVGPAAAAARVTARLVGPAPDADPVTRRPAYLYRAERAWPGATPGTPVVAYAEAPAASVGDSGAQGALVPDAAVVQWEGLAWAYRARGADRFERVRVVTDHPAAGGWVVSGPLAAGDSVVVRGAEELLSEEFRARVTVGDESGE